MNECPFCQIIAGEEPATIVEESESALIIRPLNPVTEGHLLALPRKHVVNAIENPALTGVIMTEASQYASRLGTDLNLLTSVGPNATQTVPHLHIHIVPRRPGDGLALPWTGQMPEKSPK